MTQYFLGVDGGQSSTTALIGDQTGRVLGVGRAGPCNHVGAAEGRTKFVNAMTESLRSAREAAGLGPSVRFASACLGFSGGPADKEALVHELIPSDRVLVTDDARIALAGATGGQPGVVIIAGTGSIAFGRNARGRTARAGGWGYIFGDEGGAFDLARQALRAALRAEEGWGPPTALRASFLHAAGARDVNELLHRFYTTEYPHPKIAEFAKLVSAAADSGDAVALSILEHAAQQLAGFAAAVRAQLFERGEDTLVSYLGGVFRSRPLLDRFRAVVEAEPGNRVAPPVYGPAAGALLEAYRAAGIRCVLSNVQPEKP